MSFNCPKEFFKIVQDHELGGELRVPKRFVERHWQKILNPVVLKFPNGVQQEIFWAKRDGDIWLQKNWEKIANFLKFGYVVVFEYKGGSCFKVKIFGVNTLEIDYSNMKVIDETYKAKEVVELSDDSDKSLDVENNDNDVGTSQRRKSGKRKKNLDFDATQQKFSGSKRGGVLNKAKKCSTNERTNNENPSFEIKLSRSYALPHGRVLRLPSDFSREYLNKFDEYAHIRFGEDKAMKVMVKFEDYSNANRTSIITTNWNLFVQKYELQEGDRCKFEMTQCQPLSFTVTIITRAKGTISSSNDRIGKRRGIKGTSRSYHVPSNSEGHDVMKPNTTLEICVNSSYPYIKNEFFLRHKEFNGKFVKLKMGTKYWYVTVRYYERETCRFYRGWRKFKEDCKLENGDKCLLEMVDEKKLVFEVSIEKKLVFDV